MEQNQVLNKILDKLPFHKMNGKQVTLVISVLIMLAGGLWYNSSLQDHEKEMADKEIINKLTDILGEEI